MRGTALRPGGQRGEQLQQRRLAGLAQAQVGQDAGRRGEHERPHLRLVQAGQVGAVAVGQEAAAAGAALGVDGHAGGRERVQVAVDRALRDLQPLGQLARGHPTVDLQEQQHRQQPVGAHGVDPPSRI